MKIANDTFQFSATDLSKHIACRHLTYLELSAAKGLLATPPYADPKLRLLQERGQEFEASYLEYFRSKGLSISLSGDSDETGFSRTIAAIEAGFDIIYQADLKMGEWQGRADFLRKVNGTSGKYPWTYEVMDTKLAKQTKAGTILQLCLYSNILEEIQGVSPEYLYVVTPEDGFNEASFRTDDFAAYYRFIKGQLVTAVGAFDGTIPTYPIPCAHCEVCNWWKECEGQRRQDDHLSFVAGLGNVQAIEIQKWGIRTLAAFAALPTPLPHKPSRGAIDTYERLHDQALLQLQTRETEDIGLNFLPLTAEKGLYRLPEPSPADVFFDLEGDRFIGSQGLEYLFGWVFNDRPDEYHRRWCFSPADEKKAFEEFMDMVMKRLADNPAMHIYHFSPYEPSALKRLAGRYVVKENELDHLLRAGVLIDLHMVVRQAFQAGIETYSLKELEKLHHFTREIELRDAASNLRTVEMLIERKLTNSISPETSSIVEGYNKDDCLSTRQLRDWLESIRGRLINEGKDIQRPPAKEGAANEKITEHQQRIKPLVDALLAGIPPDADERTAEEQAKWLLAHMLDWYRREKKALWWEYYRLVELSDAELLEEKSAIAGLKYQAQTPDKKSFIDQYSFPAQEYQIKEGDELKAAKGTTFGKVVSLDNTNNIIRIRKGPSQAQVFPTAVFTLTILSDDVKEDAIIRLAEFVVANGFYADGKYRAARDLLLNLPPRTAPGLIRGPNAQEHAVSWVNQLRNGVLPIQGPPGTGKSHTAAEMILSMVKAGKTVGVTALSHKVIIGLMQKINEAASKQGITVHCMRRVSELSEQPDPGIREEKDYAKIITALRSKKVNVLGGTSWLWAREDLERLVDVLFVDEAGQLSLIDTLAVSQAASDIVLLGDPQQLQQPQQGVHPEGTEVAALTHILGTHQVIPENKGIFLDVTWRLHPQICSLVSELFYESKLFSLPVCAYQGIYGNTPWKNNNLWFEPVEHNGNQSSSSEEADLIKSIIDNLIKGDVHYQDADQKIRIVTVKDIKVITPYNAQVILLMHTLPEGIQIGTVDKFQGQEAPIILLSMATSTPEDAPRGMEFLYSPNRLNVAISRAKAMFIMVANPALFQPNCRSVQQIKLANAFSRFLEVSKTSSP